MINFLMQLLSVLSSKRVQALLGLVIVHYVLPLLHVAMDPAMVSTADKALIGWLLYGLVSASTPALPGVGSILKSIFFKK